ERRISPIIRAVANRVANGCDDRYLRCASRFDDLFGILEGKDWTTNLNQEARKREFDFLSTLNHQLRTFEGGIAQLVERQLCKLEVRGSNPLASKNLVDG